MTIPNIYNKFLVCIQCRTFNQSKFIVDALNGFVKQKTSFSYYALVIDDASTDGEQEVIGSYMRDHFCQDTDSESHKWETEDAFFHFARHKENNNCFFLVIFLKNNLFATKKKEEIIKEFQDSKYIAKCEGDDYWTDPFKLQKQVSFLEDNEDYVMCGHRFSTLWQTDNKLEEEDHFEEFFKNEQKGLELNVHNYFQIGRLPQTLTLLCRSGELEKSSWFKNLNIRSNYDQTLIFALVELGKIWIMKDNMGVYRRHDGGIATSLNPRKASQKMYITWHDVYEVHPIEDIREISIWSIKNYIYYLVKHEGFHSKEEIQSLLLEYKSYNEPLSTKMKFIFRLLKGFLLHTLH